MIKNKIIITNEMDNILKMYRENEIFTGIDGNELKFKLGEDVNVVDFIKFVLVDFNDFYKETIEKFILLTSISEQSDLHKAIYKTISTDALNFLRPKELNLLKEYSVLEEDLINESTGIIEEDNTKKEMIENILSLLNTSLIIDYSLKDIKYKILNTENLEQTLLSINNVNDYLNENDELITDIHDYINGLKDNIIQKEIKNNNITNFININERINTINLNQIVMNMLNQEDVVNTILDLGALDKKGFINNLLDSVDEVKSLYEDKYDENKMNNFEKALNNFNKIEKLLEHSNEIKYIENKMNNFTKKNKKELVEIIELYENRVQSNIDNSIDEKYIEDENIIIFNDKSYNENCQKLSNIHKLTTNILKIKNIEFTLE